MRKYKRGEGKPEPVIETPRLFAKSKDKKSHGGFDVRLGYDDGSTESGVVSGPDYKTALPKAVAYSKGALRSVTLRKMEPWTREVT